MHYQQQQQLNPKLKLLFFSAQTIPSFYSFIHSFASSMGNGTGKISRCFAGAGEISRRHDIAVVLSDPLDEGLGHSFCYIRPDDDNDDDEEEEDGDRNDDESSANNDGNDNNKAAKTTTFRVISGASVSANNSTPLSTSLAGDAWCPYSSGLDRAATFESSTLFSSIPLQPVPRYSFNGVPGSGPIERGFLSGPIERAFVSGPIYSGPTESDTSFSSSDYSEPNTTKTTKTKKKKKKKKKKKSLMEIFKRVVFETVIFRGKKSIVAPIKSVVSVKEFDSERAIAAVDKNAGVASSESTTLSCSNGDEDEDGEFLLKSQNLQWAQGKAGEDRVHVVISEEHGWVFVGIYDGFNGPDAPDYLLSNLYPAVHKELKGLLWSEKVENPEETSDLALDDCVDKEPEANSRGKRGAAKGRRVGRGAKAAARWKCEWNRERMELDKELKENFNRPMEVINHPDVLRALSQALRKTEDAYLDAADKMVKENPELALMGSCVLVMLMKGEDVYLMNVGDSRAVLARKAVADLGIGRRECRDLDPINEETMQELELSNGDDDHDDGYESELSNLTSLQLTIDHSTYVEEEVQRIKNEHPDDACAVMNDRVKGYLKVTRAFGAGFLKQPKWNDALLEMFRIDYIGTCPYLTCMPSLHHHKLSSRDRFLILSSDGLYQYFTNEQAVSEVELFIASFPEGDPAQHLVEEVLFRAARKAGMDFHELLDIPQGERRRYHDDVSIIIISLEGRIWRSSV